MELKKKRTWGIQRVKNSGKVNLFAGQTIEKIFIYSRGFRPGIRVCFEHVNIWQYISLGDLKLNEFIFPHK